MFNSPDPTVVYERYRQFYVKYGGENVMNMAKEVATEFFDFTAHDNVDMKKLKKEQKQLKLRRKVIHMVRIILES